MKAAYTVTERGDKTFWTRIGAVTENADGSITVKLEAVPVNGVLIITDVERKADEPYAKCSSCPVTFTREGYGKLDTIFDAGFNPIGARPCRCPGVSRTYQCRGHVYPTEPGRVTEVPK